MIVIKRRIALQHIGVDEMLALLDSIRLRANPGYELAAYEQLPHWQQQAVAPYTTDPTFFGVLQYRAVQRRATKVVCRDTAAVYQAFLHPQRCPAELQSQIGPGWRTTLLRLLADDILEAEDDTGFISGPLFYSRLALQQGLCATSGVDQLSVAALRYAQALTAQLPSELSSQMYMYNREAITPSRKRVLSDGASIEQWLGIHTTSVVGHLLKRSWRRREASGAVTPWWTWDYPSTRQVPSSYKLYLSPTVDDVPAVFAITVELLAQLPHLAFKIGATAAGLCRPDKFVVYFDQRAALDQAAQQLSWHLRGYRSQGIPFTASIDAGGLLAWGADPPADLSPLSDAHGTSWRLWVTQRLASALVAARHTDLPDIEPWQYALFRITLDGVDSTTWTPTTPMWQRIERSTAV